MPLLLLKLLLTPLIVGGASLAARRWGPSIGGWIVSLPLTSGPVLFFLALEQGPQFAADATVGTVLGLLGICGYTVGYLAGSHRGAAAALGAATLGYVLVGIGVQPVTGAPFFVLVAIVVAAIAGVIQLLPAPNGPSAPRVHPAWDLPARIAVGTALVVGLTTIAPNLGPVASGIVATFPAYVSVLAVFEHVHGGRAAGLGTLRGLLTGLFGTVAFHVVIRTMVVPYGIAVAFPVAIAVTGVIGGLALRRVRAGLVAPGPEAM
ncbi:MAG TPA: hypothetical protein VES19_16100 [Candidatus Limnocylindrales bacterium]|nr:hypothetical protein [Candidatus Limnocylindrales bacterium]